MERLNDDKTLLSGNFQLELFSYIDIDSELHFIYFTYTI